LTTRRPPVSHRLAIGPLTVRYRISNGYPLLAGEVFGAFQQRERI
jgi:hypothetical protein